MNRENLIQSPAAVRPHVVLLGAGASLAAFPKGDASGHSLPLMDNFVDVVGLETLISTAPVKVENRKNIEEVYSNLAVNPKCRKLMKKIEGKIENYFSSLKIPRETTTYDYLLLSLRKKDAVFTFNWDPFLFDAYKRNEKVASLPEIFFLHGNVRIGICPKHPEARCERGGICPKCLSRCVNVPLLYPIGKKDYSSNEYIRRSWDKARYFFAEAFVLTIFGYGAPVSDADAVDLLKSAWMERSDRRIEHVEIIDVASDSDLYKRWKKFTPTLHLKLKDCIWKSWIMMYPRRSVESLKYPIFDGMPAETFPLILSKRLQCVHEQVRCIAAWESLEE